MNQPQSLSKAKSQRNSWEQWEGTGMIMLCVPHPRQVPELALRASQQIVILIYYQEGISFMRRRRNLI